VALSAVTPNPAFERTRRFPASSSGQRWRRAAQLADFSRRGEAPTVKRAGSHFMIELCCDTCSVYTARAPRGEEEVWDTAFLNEFFFATDIAGEAFRSTNADHAAVRLSRYAEQWSQRLSQSAGGSVHNQALGGTQSVDLFVCALRRRLPLRRFRNYWAANAFHGPQRCAEVTHAP
jgi:hypothetical protein